MTNALTTLTRTLATKLDMVHGPYEGAGPAVQDTIAGQATTGIHDFATIGPQIQRLNRPKAPAP